MYVCTHVNRDQESTMGADSLLLPCGLWGLKSGYQTSRQIPVPTELSWWPLLKMHILVFKGMAPPLLDSLAISMSQTRATLWDALWCERCGLLPLFSLLYCSNRRVQTTAQILKDSVRDLQRATSSRLAEGSLALISSRRLFCFKSSFSGLFNQAILHST